MRHEPSPPLPVPLTRHSSLGSSDIYVFDGYSVTACDSGDDDCHGRLLVCFDSDPGAEVREELLRALGRSRAYVCRDFDLHFYVDTRKPPRDLVALASRIIEDTWVRRAAPEDKGEKQ